MSTTQNGEPKPIKNFGFQKFISSSLSDVEKFTEFNGMVIFQPQANVWEISPNTDFVAWPSRIDAQCSILFVMKSSELL